MKIYKFDKLVKEASDLFDPEANKKSREELLKNTFKDQDEMAEKSDIFRRILQSEASIDPETRYEQTNSPKSKTRNALLSRGAYPTQEEWEDSLIKNPFYKIDKHAILHDKLRDEDRIPLSFDHSWDETVRGIPIAVFTSLSDDSETMGGYGISTYHALGYDKDGNFFHWKKDVYEDEDDSVWYDA